MIRIHIFAYSGDALEAVVAARCARMAVPDAVIRVLDDVHDPMDAGMVAALRVVGAGYDLTSWPRGGNLRGPGAVLGVLRSMADGADDEDILVKLDADTALLDGDWLRWMADHPECLWYSSGDVRHLVYGCCYALRTRVARHLADVLQDQDLPEDAPEDLTYGMAMIREYGLDACRIEEPWRPDKADSRWACWCWHSSTATPDLYARQFRMVTTGNPRPCGVSRHQRAEVIDQLREARERQLAAGDLPLCEDTDSPSFR